jgi:hypothetical protein
VSSGLDPARLTPAASLNRVRFVEVPGIMLPAEMLGRTAHDLLSARAYADLARQEGAEHAARRLGERLGWLIVTLRRGDADSRAARPDWDDSYWRHRAQISTVVLGGGIVSGRSGPRIAAEASRTLAEAGMADCVVRIAPWPAILPLVGAARTPPDASTMAVVDFGQSFVKRACAHYEAGALASLRLLPPVPSRLTGIGSQGDPTAEDVGRLGTFMVATLAETWRAAQAIDSGVSTTLVASLASYLRDGQPLARQGGPYAALLALSDNLTDWLSDRIGDAIGRPVTVRLFHDGTSAGRALAGEERAAVIMLGTALGVGFLPRSGPICPLTPGFAVMGASADRPVS